MKATQSKKVFPFSSFSKIPLIPLEIVELFLKPWSARAGLGAFALFFPSTRVRDFQETLPTRHESNLSAFDGCEGRGL